MKTYLIIFSVLIATCAANAQLTVGVDGGLAAPSGNFASSAASTSSDLNGFAKAGFYYDGYVGFKFIPLLGGLMAQYGANSNTLNTSAIESQPGTTNASSSGKYTTTEYLAGPYISIKLVKIKIEAKLLGGYLTNSYPSLSFDSYGNSVYQSFKTGSGFGYCIGAKVKYMLGGILGIGIGLNYVGSDVNYSGVTTTVNGSPQTSSSAKMNIGLVQATLGLSVDI